MLIIITGTPRKFQHKLDKLLLKNYPLNFNLSFSFSGNLIAFNSKNSFPVIYSLSNKAKKYGLSK